MFIYSNIHDCSSIRTIGYRYCLIVRLNFFEQSKLIFIIYNLKKLKVSKLVEDSGIEPLTS